MDVNSGDTLVKLVEIKRRLKRPTVMPANEKPYFLLVLVGLAVVIVGVFLIVKLKARSASWTLPLTRQNSHVSVASRGYHDMSPLNHNPEDDETDHIYMNPRGIRTSAESLGGDSAPTEL